MGVTAPQQPDGFHDPSGPPQQPYPPPAGGYPGQPVPYPPAPYGPPGAPYGYGFDAYGRPLSDKSKLTAGLLEIFLGSFGVGRFYLGYTGIGIAQIAVTWLTCGLGGIWPLIDGIMMLTGKVPDAEGRTLRE
jgi:TM2 domain-containing membrane protein YozV